jgi:hypothetical protein
MNKLSSTVLLVAIALLTAVCALGRITPMAWLLVYGGWIVLMQHHGRQVLKERLARGDLPAEEVAVAPVTARPRHSLPQRPTTASD